MVKIEKFIINVFLTALMGKYMAGYRDSAANEALKTNYRMARNLLERIAGRDIVAFNTESLEEVTGFGLLERGGRKEKNTEQTDLALRIRMIACRRVRRAKDYYEPGGSTTHFIDYPDGNFIDHLDGTFDLLSQRQKGLAAKECENISSQIKEAAMALDGALTRIGYKKMALGTDVVYVRQDGGQIEVLSDHALHTTHRTPGTYFYRTDESDLEQWVKLLPNRWKKVNSREDNLSIASIIAGAAWGYVIEYNYLNNEENFLRENPLELLVGITLLIFAAHYAIKKYAEKKKRQLCYAASHEALLEAAKPTAEHAAIMEKNVKDMHPKEETKAPVYHGNFLDQIRKSDDTPDTMPDNIRNGGFAARKRPKIRVMADEEEKYLLEDPPKRKAWCKKR